MWMCRSRKKTMQTFISENWKIIVVSVITTISCHILLD